MIAFYWIERQSFSTFVIKWRHIENKTGYISGIIRSYKKRYSDAPCIARHHRRGDRQSFSDRQIDSIQTPSDS